MFSSQQRPRKEKTCGIMVIVLKSLVQNLDVTLYANALGKRLNLFLLLWVKNIGCLNIPGTRVTANKSTNNNVVFFFFFFFLLQI